MLSEMMARYRDLKIQLDQLEGDIAHEVFALGESQEIDGLKVTYRKGARLVDYPAAVAALDVDCSAYIVQKINYTAACQAQCSRSELQPFTTVGNATVSFKLV
jgi:sensor domain CHASE-containing protein